MVCGARSMSLRRTAQTLLLLIGRVMMSAFLDLPRSLWLSPVVSRFTLHAPPFLVPSESDMYFRQHNAPRKRARSKTNRIVDLHIDGSATRSG